MSTPNVLSPLLSGVLLLTLSLPVLGAEARTGVTVTYIANEGLLVEGGGSKLLIDALVDGGVRGYPIPSPETQARLEAAEPPFDDVDLVLATHFHDDHFGPRAVARHLAANPRARFVSTPQAVDRLRRHLGESSPILERVRGIYPADGERDTIDVGGHSVKALNLHHGRDRRPPVENLGFLIEIEGLKLLHTGDTEAGTVDFARNRLAAEEIDVAFVGDWYLLYDHWIAALRKTLQPRRIVAFHLAERSAPAGYFGPAGSYGERQKKIRSGFPEAVILEKPLVVLNLSKGD